MDTEVTGLGEDTPAPATPEESAPVTKDVPDPAPALETKTDDE